MRLLQLHVLQKRLRKNIKFMNMRTFLFFLILSHFLSAQTFNNPNVGYRTAKTLALTKVQIAGDYLRLDFKHIGSSLYDGESWFNIFPTTEIVDSNGRYKLIKADNVSIAPGKTTVKNFQTSYFSLYFPKIPIWSGKIIHMIEDEKSFSSFNFYNITLNDNSVMSYEDSPKDEYFLRKIPSYMHAIYQSDFAFHNDKMKEYFISLTDALNKNNQYGFKVIKQSAKLKNRNVTQFSLIPDKDYIRIYVPSVYSFVNDNGKDRIRNIIFYFSNDYETEAFFKTFSEFFSLTKMDSNTYTSYKSLNNKYYRVETKMSINNYSKDYTVEVDIE